MALNVDNAAVGRSWNTMYKTFCTCKAIRTCRGTTNLKLLSVQVAQVCRGLCFRTAALSLLLISATMALQGLYTRQVVTIKRLAQPNGFLHPSRLSTDNIGGMGLPDNSLSNNSSNSSKSSTVPKVALLLRVRDGSFLPNEPVWRAFFEAAARLQLQPELAKEAAEAAQHAAASRVHDVLGNTPLHPSLQPQQPWTYPDYRMQHGLTPGAMKLSSHEASMHQENRSSRAGRSNHGRRTSNSSSIVHAPAWLQFSAAVRPSEQALLVTEMERLLQASSREGAAAHILEQQVQPGHSQSAAWDPMLQVSTAAQAADLEPQEQRTTRSSGEKVWARLHKWLGRQQHRPRQQRVQDTEDARGSTAGSQSTGDSRKLPLHPVLQQQQLFSVYVHTPHGELLPPGSLFAGCELRWRINTTNGYAQHVLAEAAVLLLRAALQDRLNTHFVVLSDSSIPIYPPQVVWAQLMSEKRSRINACPSQDLNIYRWPKGMASDYFGRQHWRQSSQWFAVTRPIALLAVADSHVRELFHRHCFTNFSNPNYGQLCVSSEHYLPSLLASYGLDNATDCQGSATHADFSGGGWHPKSFKPRDISPLLVQHIRNGGYSPGSQPAPEPDTAVVLPTHDEAQEEAVINAIEATIAAEEADMAATAKAGQHGKEAPPDQPFMLPRCGVEEAIQSASKLFTNAARRHLLQPSPAFDISPEVESHGDGAAGGDPRASGSSVYISGEAAASRAHKRNLLSVRLSNPSLQLPSIRGQQRQPLDDSSGATTLHQQLQASRQPRFKTRRAAWIVAAGYAPLAFHCPLFARKFTAAVTNHTLAMALSCAGIGLGSWCSA